MPRGPCLLSRLEALTDDAPECHEIVAVRATVGLGNHLLHDAVGVKARRLRHLERLPELSQSQALQLRHLAVKTGHPRRDSVHEQAVFLGHVLAVDHPDVDRGLGGLLDFLDLDQVETFLQRRADDRVRLVAIQIPIRPSNGGQCYENVSPETGRILRHEPILQGSLVPQLFNTIPFNRPMVGRCVSVRRPSDGPVYRVGVDENGLGARLGPLVVTAVLARVHPGGTAVVEGRLPQAVASDLDDSKRLVSHSDVRLGEAWARAVVGSGVRTPRELFRRLSLEGERELRHPCPERAETQCWRGARESFRASEQLVDRIRSHVQVLSNLGVEIVRVRTSVVCTELLNRELAQGRGRFTVDLHAMERLILSLHAEAGTDLDAVCGKVGAIGDYPKFFGPLGGRLHVVLEQGAARSTYQFPGLGVLSFVRDADERYPLVMLASLVGKYIRELLMNRIAGYYFGSDEEPAPSGYHDPVTDRFVQRTEAARRELGVPQSCFERARRQKRG